MLRPFSRGLSLTYLISVDPRIKFVDRFRSVFSHSNKGRWVVLFSQIVSLFSHSIIDQAAFCFNLLIFSFCREYMIVSRGGQTITDINIKQMLNSHIP